MSKYGPNKITGSTAIAVTTASGSATARVQIFTDRVTMTFPNCYLTQSDHEEAKRNGPAALLIKDGTSKKVIVSRTLKMDQFGFYRPTEATERGAR